MQTYHPDDESLAAFAGADPDAADDASLSQHISSCERCTSVIGDLRGLRAALAVLPDPDLLPPRPLRLLPPVPEPRPTFADRVAAVVRRAFAPALTAGAALALVGTVGTTGFAENLLGGQAAAPAAAPAIEEPAASARELAATEDAGAPDASAAAGAPGFEAAAGVTPSPASRIGDSVIPLASDASETAVAEAAGGDGGSQAGSEADERGAYQPFLPAERSVWPVILFGGVALMVLALLLRWIFQPRAA